MQNTNERGYDRLKLKKPNREEPRINMRPFLFIALGLAFGILLYTRCRFGGARGTDFVLFGVLLLLSFCPPSRKRIVAVLLCFLFAASAGAGLMHLKCESYGSGVDAGEYEVSGVVISFTIKDGRSDLVLNHLTIDGQGEGGRMYVSVPSEAVRAGDKIRFHATVSRGALPRSGDTYAESLFIKDIRYFASASEAGFSVMGRGNALLRLNAAVYDVLHDHLSKTQADTAYALVTGNAGSMDDSFTTAVRQGGVAHIFAVSGLHIGILYGAVAFVFRRLKRFSPIPAIVIAVLYAAFCGFSVSSVRAVIMCAVLGVYGALGRKYDFLGTIAFAATLVLLVSPAQWLAVGFRLSFGACIALALYAQRLRRAFSRLPHFVADYLAANLAVLLFTLPVMLNAFGYLSLWGIALNVVLVPALPVLFLGLFLTILFSLVIPPAAGVFLALPNGMLSLFSWIFSFDFSFVLSGFALGAGGAIYTGGAVLLSDRVRLGERAKVYCTIFLTALFALVLVLENAVLVSCKIISGKGAVLVESPTQRVLVIDGSLSVKSYQNFLDRYYGGTLDAVVVASGNIPEGLSDALYLPAREIRAAAPRDTGFSQTRVLYEQEFSYGKMKFYFESEGKLTLTIENRTVEIDFTGNEALHSDLFLAGDQKGIYYINRGEIYRGP